MELYEREGGRGEKEREVSTCRMRVSACVSMCEQVCVCDEKGEVCLLK